MLTNTDKNSDISLNGGLGGEAFLNLIKGKKNGNEILQMHGELALDSVGHELQNYSDFSFANGIVGIGWMIEFCAQNNLINIDSDKILEDVDDKIYQFTLLSISKNVPNVTEILDLITYYELRLLKKNSSAHYYRRFTHLECLILLIETAKKKIKVDTFLKNSGTKYFNEVVLTLLKFSHLTYNGISDTLFEEELYGGVEFFITHFELVYSLYQKNSTDASEITKLYMLLCMTARQYNNRYWVIEMESFYNKLREDFSSIINTDFDFYTRITMMELIYDEPLINENLFNSITGNQGHIELLTFYLSNYRPFSLSLI